MGAFIVRFFFFQELNVKKCCTSIAEAAETTGMMLIILLFSTIAGRIMTAERIPQDITDLIVNLFHEPWLILLAVNLFLILAGMLMDDISITVIISPLLLPLMKEIGVHPIHFAAIVGTSIVIEANSPPTAPLLYLACSIGKVKLHQTIKPALVLMIFVALPVAILTTYVQSTALALPKFLRLI